MSFEEQFPGSHQIRLCPLPLLWSLIVCQTSQSDRWLMRWWNSEPCLTGPQWSNMLRCCYESKEAFASSGGLLGSPKRGRESYQGASSFFMDDTSFSVAGLLSKSEWNPHKHCLMRRTNQTNSNSLFYVCRVKCWYWEFIFILMFNCDVGVPL